MHELEQFRSRLLFGGVNVLVTIHNIDIDRELVAVRRQRSVSLRDFGIALRAEIPDCRGIFDQKRERLLIEKRQDARGVGSDSVFHSWIETIVHVCENNVEIGLHGTELRREAEPLLLHAARETGAEVEELAQ